MLALGVSDEAAENTFCILMKPLIPPRKTLSLWATAGLDAVPKISLQCKFYSYSRLARLFLLGRPDPLGATDFVRVETDGRQHQ